MAGSDLAVGKGSYFEVVARDCEVYSVGIDELVELMKRMEDRMYVVSYALESVRDMIRLMLPDHSDVINVHVALCREPNKPVIVIEVPHFEHCSTTDVMSLARVMMELERSIGKTDLQMLLCNAEYLAIVTWPEGELAVWDVINIVRELRTRSNNRSCGERT